MSAFLLLLALSAGDGLSTRPACTSFIYDSASGSLSFQPVGCLGTAPTTGDTLASLTAFVNTVYLAEIGRAADPGGLGYWPQAILDKRNTKQELIDRLHGSDEGVAWRASQQPAPPAPPVPGGVNADQLFTPNNFCNLKWPYSPCGASPVPVGDCSSGMPGQITQAWQLNLLGDYFTQFTGHTVHMTMAKGQALSIMFHTGTRPATILLGGFGQGTTTQGAESQTFMSVSTKRCDFDYSKMNTYKPPDGACYRSIGGTENNVTTRFSPPGTPSDETACELAPNTDYYVNFRWEAASGASRGTEACNVAGTPYTKCGAVLSFR